MKKNVEFEDTVTPETRNEVMDRVLENCRKKADDDCDIFYK